MADRQIEISEHERQTGVLSDTHLRLATLLLNYRGYVILQGALPVDLITAAYADYRATLADCQRAAHGRTDAPEETIAEEPWTASNGTRFFAIKDRYRVFPRLEGPFGDERIIANPLAMAILERTLGEGSFCSFVGSDTCARGAILQSPHRDVDYYEDGVRQTVFINIPLMHCGLHNGPLEVYPGGSHLWRSDVFSQFGLVPYTSDGRNPAVEEFAEYLASTKVDMRPGDLLLRDPGMWHRGTPNPTDEPRTMLTIGYLRRGYTHGYGNLQWNLDDGMYRKLTPAARRPFRHAFEPAV